MSNRSRPLKEAFLREMVQGYRLCEKPDPEFYKIVRELSAIGNRINKLASQCPEIWHGDAPMLSQEARSGMSFRWMSEKYLLPQRHRDNGSL